MPRLTIDGREIEVDRGSTVLEAARALGISVPTLCHGEGLPRFSSCMVCAVKDLKAGRFLPSCEAKALDGMELEASGDEVTALRREALTLLLREHAGDCEAPCRRACPAGLDIPGMMRLIRDGSHEQALVLVKESIPFPGVLGRICPAPCEKVCFRSLAEGPVSIRRLHGFVAASGFETSAPIVPDGKPASGKTVAVVGAGPAGLSAAWFLLRGGHEVAIYEKEQAAGGWMRTGTSRDDLPLSVLNVEIGVIGELGAEFRLGTKLGKDITLHDLREDHDVVVLAMGETSAGELEALGLKGTSRGVAVESGTFLTELPGVFAVGDVVKAGSMLARAIAAGRSLSLSVGRFLSGEEVKGPEPSFQSRLGRLSAVEAEDFLVEGEGRRESGPKPRRP